MKDLTIKQKLGALGVWSFAAVATIWLFPTVMGAGAWVFRKEIMKAVGVKVAEKKFEEKLKEENGITTWFKKNFN